MNNNYYNPGLNTNPNISNTPGLNTNSSISNNPLIMTPGGLSEDLPMEQSYVENILRMNKGKIASIYMTFPDSNEYRDRIFTGVVEQAARDHVVLSDPKTGKWYLLLSIYIDFIVFDEEINYKVI